MPVPEPINVPAFVRFRESHHAVARWFALGLTISNVAEKTGYTRRRLHILLRDPTFQELIVSYHNLEDPKWKSDMDVYDDLQRSNMILAEQQLRDRLEDEDNPLPVSLLDRISQGRADRTGYSKHSTVKHEHSFADRLDAAIERSNKARIIEARPIPTPTPKLVQSAPATTAGPHPQKRKI